MIRKLLLTLALSFAALLPFALSTANAAELETVTLDVPGMTCKFCPITVRKALEKVPGVTDATSNYEARTATVTFDPDKAKLSDLTAATANAGYESIVRKQ